MGNIDFNGKLWLHRYEEERLNLIKSRTNSECNMCKRKVPKGSYCYGKGYDRICLSCCEIYFNNVIESFKEHIQKVISVKEKFLEIKDKCLKNNILTTLENK